MRKRRIILIFLLVVVIIGAVFGVKLYLDLRTYKQQVEDIVVTNVALSKIKDGTYNGSYETLMVSAEVDVTVENGKISRIDLVLIRVDFMPTDVWQDRQRYPFFQ